MASSVSEYLRPFEVQSKEAREASGGISDLIINMTIIGFMAFLLMIVIIFCRIINRNFGSTSIRPLLTTVDRCP